MIINGVFCEILILIKTRNINVYCFFQSHEQLSLL